MQDWILPLLRCPGSGDSLRLEAGKLHGPKQAYPFLNGIPCLYPNPGMGLLEWGTKIQHYLQEESQQIAFAQALSQSAQSALTKGRLKQQAIARQHNLSYLQQSLHAFLTYPQVPVLPSSQQIYSYFKLFFRDWCWPGDELQQYLEYVSAHLAKKAQNVLVLGSGAGGLSYGLAERFPDVRFVSLEHNPFLALTADAIMQGQKIALYDYSLYPSSIEKTAQRWSIQKPPLVVANHQSIIASYPQLPFAPQSFDYIIAPWFLDILDMPFSDAIRALLPALKKDASLIFFGPANVHKSHAEQQWTPEEICDAFGQYFQRVSSDTSSLTYLNSNLDSQHRLETLLFAHCQQPRNKSPKPVAKAAARLQLTPELLQYKAVNETFYKVLSVIDKDITAPELATLLVSKFGFDNKESLYYAEFFIRKIAMDIGQ
ncbi:class I SAM-dependent methyltransferase [Arsukibacterium sp.]|uniref:class I SAM-dependent methyltransferase n=1 Tax=Arsukibacterium sp. TaxID=1977258 RepID=UPI002FD89EBC